MKRRDGDYNGKARTFQSWPSFRYKGKREDWGVKRVGDGDITNKNREEERSPVLMVS